MKINSCYVCGKPIPELKMKDGKYSFYCDKCTCATKQKEDLFKAQSDWNEGYVYPEDEDKYWKLMFNSKK
jgi:hypothetical protein